MSEGRAKKRAHVKVLETCPQCIYCGGEVLATTIDHVPPRIVFRGRHRPKGLEFASCGPCNVGTGKADLVVGLLSRAAPDGVDETEKAELRRLLSGVSNNVPGLLEEMYLGEREQVMARRRLQQPVDGGFLKTDGPLVSAHMQTFATKLGFALFYEVTRQIVPIAGGVAARWYSNVDRLEGTFPQSVFDILLPPETLRQGRFNVSDQFSYQWRITEGDRAALFFASFRQSFAVLAFAAVEKSIFDVETDDPMRLVSPREITKFLKLEPQETKGARGELAS